MRLRPPTFGSAPAAYDRQYFDMLWQTLRTYFGQAAQPYEHYASSLNLNLNTLPTDADLATLRAGDVYRDTTAGNVLKIKT